MEKLNIAELLKDCPSGMELDCTMYNKVTLIHVNDKKDTIYPIKVFREDGNTIALTKYGQYTDADFAKCIIFPKGKATWEGFVPQIQFKEGDIIYNRHQRRICIFRYHNNSLPCISYCRYNCYHDEFEILKDDLIIVKQDYRLATEDEKEKLFQAIKDNGYKWNAETKTLEKLIEPKFKVGDYVRKKGGVCDPILILEVKDDSYFFNAGYLVGFFGIKEQDDWVLVPKKFDITTLKPFDKVLVRQSDAGYWKPAFWGKRTATKKCPFITSYGATAQVIPFKGNEWLVGTTDDCDDFYKTW